MTSEKTGSAEIDHQEEIQESPAKASKSYMLIVINIVLLIVLAATGAYNIKSIREIKEDNSASQLIHGIDQSVEQVSQQVSDLNARLQQYETDMLSLSTTVEQSNESLEILYSSQGDQNSRLSATEVEHLINIANIKLKLEANTEAAIVALEEANNRLAEMGDPRLFSLRRQITSDINTIKSIPKVDIVGMSFTLSDLATRASKFSLKNSAVAGETQIMAQTNPADPAWKRLLLGVWNEFKSMFIITRTGEDMSTSLLPNEKFFLYQNLRLQLESARFAVLRRDPALLQDSLSLAETWLEDYFDLDDAAVKTAIEIIVSIKKMDLDQPVPDISASVQAINSYLEEVQTSNTTEDVIE